MIIQIYITNPWTPLHLKWIVPVIRMYIDSEHEYIIKVRLYYHRLHLILAMRDDNATTLVATTMFEFTSLDHICVVTTLFFSFTSLANSFLPHVPNMHFVFNRCQYDRKSVQNTLTECYFYRLVFFTVLRKMPSLRYYYKRS